MKRTWVVLGLALAFDLGRTQTPTERIILSGNRLAEGFDLGVDTNLMRRDWVTPQPDSLKLSYPAGQAWGAVFITVGQPVNPPGLSSISPPSTR
jgi:hypothetical protein